MANKVLFMGCNSDQVPYLKAIKALGYTVIGTDMNAKAPGAPLTDRFYKVGYTNLDGLKEVARSEQLSSNDLIFTAAAHFAYEGASKLAASLGIPFIKPEAVDTCLDKVKFYSLLQKCDVPIPPTSLYDVSNPPNLRRDKIYFLKSDYGKSPNYCYRIINGQVPKLPQKFDSFYRRTFVLQEEIKGMHYRVNLYCDKAAAFLKFSDTAAVPVSTLGPRHSVVINKLLKIASILGATDLLTKFDLIVNENGWYVLDIGLDPPMRMKLLCDYLGLDFPASYIRYYLLHDKTSLPNWEDICKPIIIRGSPLHGYDFINLGDVQ